MFAMKTVRAGLWPKGDEISISIGVGFEFVGRAQLFACIESAVYRLQIFHACINSVITSGGW